MCKVNSVVIEIGSSTSAVTKVAASLSVTLIARFGFSRNGDKVIVICTRVPSGYGFATIRSICTSFGGSGVAPSSKKKISCTV